MTETHTVGVTGAAGYIGSRVTATLIDAGHDVVPLDNFRQGDVGHVDGVSIQDVDVRDTDAVRDAFADVDAVMHLAAISGVQSCAEHESLAFETNVRATESLAWFCREAEIPLVFPCSMAIIGNPQSFPITADHPRNPLNFYGRTKAMSEEDIHHLAEGHVPAHVMMKSNLYGFHEIEGNRIGKDTVINIFVEKALDGEPLTVHEPGTQARDFLHVKDVARAYPLALDALMDELAAGDDGAVTYPLASGECLSILDLAELVQDVVAEERGDEIPIEMVENPRGGEAVGEDFTVDTDAARERIGFEAEHDVEETVRTLVRAAEEDGR